MNKKVILVDMDDVIENFVPAWLEGIYDQFGVFKTSEDINEWEIMKAFPDNTKEEIYSIIEDPGFWETVTPKEDAMKYIPMLQEYFDVYIVTASDFGVIDSKINDLLFKYFPTIDKDHVIICQNKQMIKGDVIIDDGLHNLIGHDAIKLLYDTPHNRNASLPKDIYRVYSWKEIYAFMVLSFLTRDNAEHCVICGEIIPEGRQVCKSCEDKIMGGRHE